MNRVFFNESFEEGKGKIFNEDIYQWIISADRIFQRDPSLVGFEGYTEINHVEYAMYKPVLYDNVDIAKCSFFAKEVTVKMFSGLYCPVLEQLMANSTMIKVITIQKIHMKGPQNTSLEKKEFRNCIINKFEVSDSLISFSFRYTAFEDMINKDSTNGATLHNCVKVDLVKWEVSGS